MFTRKNDQLPYLRSMQSCLSRVVTNGYATAFQTVGKGISAGDNDHVYQPDEVKTISVFRFQGEQQVPGHSATLYIIETMDGTKGTLVAKNGQQASAQLNSFMETALARTKGK
ncbi:MAG: hypothetical protein P0Y53_13470 [Candidatus Pseudobacter hemicellulosilyticus]|uniref:Uncharacterized protein n=1 Tax=Candidatus Pseudobacter hemicellulosilyticus TaxID=3121375 RepID=A0AAJ5WS52_9BACT|nr:MAG: hypothetical protein P0Y53_13470 [Pseudobacter sp.]